MGILKINDDDGDDDQSFSLGLAAQSVQHSPQPFGSGTSKSLW